MSESNERTVALVTGANRGIGKEVSKQLAERGYEVLLSARDGEKAEAAAAEIEASLSANGGGAGGSIRAFTLDVSSPDSIEKLVQQLNAERDKLDVLVNNAGAGLDFGISGLEPDFELIQGSLETNFYGAYRLTIGLLELLRKSEHPRIVNVSSGMGGVAEMGGWSPGYRISKAALNATTRILSTELRPEGFLVNSACPGFVKTDMGGPMGAQKSVEDGASGIVWLAALPDDGPTGGFFRDGKAIAF